eukprot:6849587-Pyramimonas_sp.AAC.1
MNATAVAEPLRRCEGFQAPPRQAPMNRTDCVMGRCSNRAPGTAPASSRRGQWHSRVGYWANGLGS